MIKDSIYYAICDIAEDLGVTAEELVLALKGQNDEMFEKALSSLPEGSAIYVKSARNDRQLARDRHRREEEQARLSRDVKRFRELFPQVEAAGIPDAVWQDMTGGIPLPYAYALYIAAGNGKNEYAKEVNARNGFGALPPVNAHGENDELTMEEVEAMSPEAVKNSFPRILRSIGKWKM